MKKFLSMLSLVLVLALVVGMFGCSSYGKLKSAFEDEGYTEVSTNENAEAMKKEAEELGISVDVHVMTKKTAVAVILEFENNEKLAEFFKDSDTAKGVAKDIKNNEDLKALHSSLENAGFAKGNCLVIGFGVLDAILGGKLVTEIVKGA